MPCQQSRVLVGGSDRPDHVVLQPELVASEEEGLHDLAGEGSCSDGMVDGSSLPTHGSILPVRGKHKE